MDKESIHSAVLDSDIEKVTRLLDTGSHDIEEKDEEEKTPLFVASQEGDVDMVKLLLGRGADIATNGPNGYTPLHIASENGFQEVVKILLEQKPEVNPKENQWGSTPLICASFWGYSEIVALLLKSGADPSIEAYFGYSPLCCAAIKGHANVISILLDNENKVNVESKTSNGYTSLLHAVSNGHKESVKVLLDHGANVHVTDSMGTGILHILASKGEEEQLEEFLKLGVDAKQCDHNDNTPLHAAVKGDQLSIVKRLIEAGCDLNQKNHNKGFTALHTAAAKGNTDIVRCLVKAKADASLKSNDGDTAIDIAHFHGNTTVVEILKLVSDLSENIEEREKEFRLRCSSITDSYGDVRYMRKSSHGPKPRPRKNTGSFPNNAESFRERANTHPMVVKRQTSTSSTASNVSNSSSQYIAMSSSNIQSDNTGSDLNIDPFSDMVSLNPNPISETSQKRSSFNIQQIQNQRRESEELDNLKKQVEILKTKQRDYEEIIRNVNYSKDYSSSSRNSGEQVTTRQSSKSQSEAQQEVHKNHQRTVPAPPQSPQLANKKSRNPFKYIFRKKKSVDKYEAAEKPQLVTKQGPKEISSRLEDLHISESLKKRVASVYVEFDRIILGDLLGKGNFGRVYHGNLRTGKEYNKVAVKSTKYRADEQELIESFLEEALIMKDFSHNHVLSLIGVTFDVMGNPLVILPYMAQGNLRTYIRSPDKSLSIHHLLQLAIQVARGMEYLSERKFIHRDLACRNCMVDQSGDSLIVKVADFGLSRDLFSKDYYRLTNRKTPLPVRWMAPEALNSEVFLLESDVWSFGVLIWELLTRGKTPYEDFENQYVQNYIFKGNRLEKPDYCPDNVYGIMQACWNMDPQKRPSFKELVADLEQKVYFAKKK